MYENARAAARRAAAGLTPVYDGLVAEFRTNFRAVPGEPWTEYPMPRFAELPGSGDLFTLPPGGFGGL